MAINNVGEDRRTETVVNFKGREARKTGERTDIIIAKADALQHEVDECGKVWKRLDATGAELLLAQHELLKRTQTVETRQIARGDLAGRQLADADQIDFTRGKGVSRCYSHAFAIL